MWVWKGGDASAFKIVTFCSNAFSPSCDPLDHCCLELVVLNGLQGSSHRSLQMCKVVVSHPSQLLFEQRKKPKIALGEIRAVGGLGKEVLIEEESQGVVGGVGGGIVMVDDKFSICLAIHSSFPHARMFFPDSLS